MEQTNDRELLEAAARAAGLGRVVWNDEAMYAGKFGALLTKDGIGERTWWNPLMDDGDALRLAVKLNLDVDICFSAASVCYVFTNTAGDEDADHVSEPTGDDPAAATRRAIVRAAAAIATAENARFPKKCQR
jgi:hypothetical protein